MERTLAYIDRLLLLPSTNNLGRDEVAELFGLLPIQAYPLSPVQPDLVLLPPSRSTQTTSTSASPTPVASSDSSLPLSAPPSPSLPSTALLSNLPRRHTPYIRYNNHSNKFHKTFNRTVSSIPPAFVAWTEFKQHTGCSVRECIKAKRRFCELYGQAYGELLALLNDAQFRSLGSRARTCACTM